VEEDVVGEMKIEDEDEEERRDDDREEGDNGEGDGGDPSGLESEPGTERRGEGEGEELGCRTCARVRWRKAQRGKDGRTGGSSG
jgi:hypothetical protein